MTAQSSAQRDAAAHRQTPSQRLTATVRDVDTTEILVAAALVLALWVPTLAGGRVWLVPIAALLVYAAWRAAVTRPRLTDVAPPTILAYIAALAAAAVASLHSLGSTDVARYFVRPLIAVAVATTVSGPRRRLRILAMIVAAATLELPVTAGQALAIVAHYGRQAADRADSVTGTFGPSQAGVVTLAAVAAAILVAAAYATRLISGRLALLAPLLTLVGAFTSARAVVGYAPIVALVLLAAIWVAYGRRRLRTGAAVFAIGLVLSPALYAVTRALYANAFVGAVSSQNTAVVGGAAAQGLVKKKKPSGKVVYVHRATPPPASEGGVLLLPGRFEQIRLALRLSHTSGPRHALVGFGLGASTLDPSYRLAQDVPPVQRTGSTWISVVLVDAGWLGLLAFAGLLLWLCLLGWRLARGASNAVDRALGLALPAIAALTAMGAVFATILDVRGYSLPFWLIVGLAISAAAEQRSAPSTQP